MIVVPPPNKIHRLLTHNNGIIFIMWCPKSVHLLQICFMGLIDVLSAPHGCCQKCNCDEESKNESIYKYIYIHVLLSITLQLFVWGYNMSILWNLFCNVGLNKHSSSPINKAPSGYSFIALALVLLELYSCWTFHVGGGFNLRLKEVRFCSVHSIHHTNHLC